MKYTTADGKTFTDKDIETWCGYYEQSEFLPNSKTTEVISGKPQHTVAKVTE